MYIRVIILLVCVCKCLQLSSDKKPNFVFVLTDDQDLLLNGLTPMTKTLQFVANEGMFFEKAFANTPVCCPSRSSILTGMYAHNVHVYNNSISGNCSSVDWQNNYEQKSIAAILKEEGRYKTFYAGKYLNQYGSKKANGVGHVPKGYDWWIALKGNSRYYNYTLSINGAARHNSADYLTDVIKNYALDFLNHQHRTNESFFMMIAPPAPHAPFTPAPRHRNAFPDAKAVRSSAFNYTPTEKHWIVRMRPDHLPNDATVLDSIQRHRLATLLSVDEMVDDIIKALKQLNALHDTYIMFFSDNGFHIGQFTQPWDKRQPYQSDINVPFFMRGPGIPKKTLSSFPISAIDVAPTILDLAGIKIPSNMDGTSFKEELFYNNCSNCAKRICVEYWGEGDNHSIDPECHLNTNNDLAECTQDSWCKCQDSRNNTYRCVVDINQELYFKFCKFADNEHFYEAYNLLDDPYELHNIFESMEVARLNYYIGLVDRIGSCFGKGCQGIM